MKLTISQSDLSNAISFCKSIIRSADNAAPHLLFTTHDNALEISSHNNFSCKTISVPAKVFAEGSFAIPLDQVQAVASSAPKDQPLNIVIKDRATITWGRSRYIMPVLAADQFPPLFAAKGQFIMLSESDRQSLFERPAQLCLTDLSALLYAGCFLHDRDGVLSSISSDGTRMLCCKTSHKFDGLLVAMVPRELCLEVSRMASDAVCWDNHCLTASQGNKRITGKLHAIKYGNYASVVPAAEGPALKFNRLELIAALRRLSALATHGSVIGLHWLDNPKEATLELGQSGNREIISCAGKISAGALGLAPIRFSDLIELVGGDAIMVFVSQNMRPLRIVSNAEPETLVMAAPCRSPLPQTQTIIGG